MGGFFGNRQELVPSAFLTPLSVLAKSKACTETVGPALNRKKKRQHALKLEKECSNSQLLQFLVCLYFM